MEVKTNKEYTAMQHEIETAASGVATFEDQILTLMMEADELTAAVKAADAALAAEEAKAKATRADVDTERGRLEAEVAALAATRTTVESEMKPEHVRLFVEGVAKRRGIAVSAIRDGHCQACQVRMRPQLLMDIRKGEQIFECESCKRILYVPPAAPAAPPAEVAGGGTGA
jgi:predicted  nucleic acid-binding Zn-ribbon protein